MDYEELLRAAEGDWIWKRGGWMRTLKISARMERFSESIAEREDGLRKSFGEEFFRPAAAECMANELCSSWAIEGIGLDFCAVRSIAAGALNAGIPEWETGAGPFRKEQAAAKATLAMLDGAKELDAGRLLEVHAMLEGSQERGALWGKFRSCGVHVRDGGGGIVYVAPPAECVDALMEEYLSWWKDSRRNLSRPLGSALAHLWFVAIHPFEDGNGRTARMLAERYMAGEGCPASAFRPYSVSSEIWQSRSRYYETLKMATRHASVEPYLDCMLSCRNNALKKAARRAYRLQEMKERMGAAWDDLPREERDVLRFFCCPFEPDLFGSFGGYARRFPIAAKAFGRLEAKGILRNGAIAYPQAVQSLSKGSGPDARQENDDAVPVP